MAIKLSDIAFFKENILSAESESPGNVWSYVGVLHAHTHNNLIKNYFGAKFETNMFKHIFYKQLCCLAPSLRFRPKIKQLLIENGVAYKKNVYPW